MSHEYNTDPAPSLAGTTCTFWAIPGINYARLNISANLASKQGVTLAKNISSQPRQIDVMFSPLSRTIAGTFVSKICQSKLLITRAMAAIPLTSVMPVFCLLFQRATHYTAKRSLAIACRLCMCPFVHPSVTLVDQDHIGCTVQFMTGQGSCCCPVDLGRKVGPSAIP